MTDIPVPFSDDGKLVSSSDLKRPWEEIAERKRADREQKLRKRPEWLLKQPVPTSQLDVSNVVRVELSKEELTIVSSDATELVEKLADGRLKAVAVVCAFCHAASLAQQLTNCLSEICFEDAIKRAEELDDYFTMNGGPIGPLHGLPVSIKDHIMVHGLDTATGYVSWCYRTIAEKDAVAVNILKQAGAVIYVKTNNPQTLLSLETDNNIYGKTLNPLNRELTPGGSSGGESALIAFLGSPLGIGTDIGGSIRLPAACTGLYGLKASVGRIPHAGLLGSHDGMDAIVGVLGPLARSARDLSLFCKVMLEYKPWLVEPPLLEIPWKEDIVKGAGIPSKLSFAMLWDDGVVKPHPPIQAAMQNLKQQLVDAGHEVIDWTPIDHKYAWELITKLYFLDGGEEYRAVLAESGEPQTPQTEWILSQVSNNGHPFTVAEIFKLNLERERFRVNLAEHWNQTKSRTTTGRPIDAIISPCAPSLPPKHAGTRWWGYTSYWNLADYPAATFPIGRFDPQELVKLPENDIMPTLDEDHKKFVSCWEPSTYSQFPVCLQLIGRRLNEEKVLGMLNILERAANVNGNDSIQGRGS